MNTRRLSVLLVAGGLGLVLLAVVWFIVAFADAMDMAGSFMGDDYSTRLMACLYSSAALCEGAGAFSEGPAYSPVLFWLGLVAVLVGAVVGLSSREPAGEATRAAEPGHSLLTGVLAPANYARFCYQLALGGAIGGLLLLPLAVAAWGAMVLALLGLTHYRAQLSALGVSHLGLILLVCTVGGLLLYLSRGSALFLLVGLLQALGLYVGFNSYRHQRQVGLHNAKDECIAAFRRAPSANLREPSANPGGPSANPREPSANQRKPLAKPGEPS
ncbi:hypothetical protein [Parahaliea mediterranea]|uniref:hypothetical protein n=1 Tax=Parahaliea mediterranea TaxID=651086 RepID=UPI000E2FC198|nr:hypothetical protein [Parahaliea mediterranea]